MTSQQLYEQYTAQMHKIADVKYALAVLQWDQETYLPAKGASLRGQQMATLSEIAHQLFAEEKLGSLLNELSAAGGLTDMQQRNVALTLEDYKKNKKYTSAFVRELAEATSRSYHAWIEARKQNDFRVFEKSLGDLIRLKKEEVHILGFEQHPYDALLNEFEKGATVAWLDALFDELQQPLQSLLSTVMQRPQPDDGFLHQHFDKDAQWRFGLDMLKRMGYDFEAGRQDISEHPFTTSFNTSDVRVTTRIDENDFTSMTWSCLHEGGHALYEQGLPANQYGLPLGEYCSLGIHESQSRLWENCIGRNKAFIEHNIPLIRQYFPQLNQAGAQQLFAAVNKVKPSLIRTEADELTYHFHVMIRYALEKKLVEGSVDVKDIPSFWNESYKTLLGVDVPDDKNGCLQDIHWSHGSFGYFPTYSLGSLYAAQFFAGMQKQYAGLTDQIANGDYTLIHQWLQTHVYQYGRAYTSSELCNKITDEPLQLKYFMQYLTNKYRAVYHF
ncbi:carboxypeptidase M32 [Agriterribacter sp.]|uniref:carboxypeptidase M32 n=1 Tax=Agriterribacter sp. TaxID=2821509 RepID=UPI002D000507|nr:carboxypeptidase M32 [Agriterribacter sp.]HRO47774.1 carboxypeptidase M32 [Agriterribacter sp.]HRQ17993.1 carboxypeptidase M32 [Agriterribacter sp.]